MSRRPANPRSLAPWRRKAIRTMEASRRATLTFLEHVPEPEILRPRTHDRWSVKDLLAHVAGWEEETVRRLELIARGRGDRVHFFHDMAEADRFNARAVARGRRLRLPALLRHLARVRRRLVAALDRVPLEALRDPAREYTVVEWLPELAWEHEQSHLREMKAWWRARSRAGRRGERARRGQ